MRRYIALELLILLSVTSLSFSFASENEKPSPTVKVIQVEEEGRFLRLTTQIRDFPAQKIDVQMIDSQSGRNQIDLTTPAMKLWILIDQSSLCQSAGLSAPLTALFARLPDILHPKSLVTIVGYQQGSTTVLANQTSPASAASLKLKCVSDSPSVSFDTVLNQLLRQNEMNDLSHYVWVYSSGNILLSSATIQLLQEQKAHLNLSLYLPLVAAQIQPLIEINRQTLAEHFSFSIFEPSTGPQFPLLPLIVKFSPPWFTRGTTQTFEAEFRGKVEPAAEATVLASTSFTAAVPHFWFANLLLSTEFRILILLGFALIVYLTIRRYFPKKCGQCNLTIRFADQMCFFCHDQNAPTLVGHNRYLRIPTGGGTLYQGRYGVSLKGRRKNALAKIECRNTVGPEVYALMPANPSITSNNGLQLNSQNLDHSMLIKIGDRIKIGNEVFSFLTAQKNKLKENSNETLL